MRKHEVRALAKSLDLSVWDAAASPCLRSRLALGIEASKEHLAAVEAAEHGIRSLLNIQPSENVRVRLLPKNRIAVEVDEAKIKAAKSFIDDVEAVVEDALRHAPPLWQSTHDVLLRRYKYGSVAVPIFKKDSG